MKPDIPGNKDLNTITSTPGSKVWIARKTPSTQMDNNSSPNDIIKNEGTPDDYRKFAITKYAYDFTENIGFQGIRYIFMKDAYWMRRLFWFMIFLAGTIYCGMVSVKNIQYYMSHPTSTKTEWHSEDKLEFPAVTICNYNMFQRSKLNITQREMIEQMYTPFEGYYTENPWGNKTLDLDSLLKSASYDYLGNIGICTFGGRQCNRSQMYTKMRDVGLCLTFDPSKDDSTKFQTLQGLKGGLTISFAIDQEDWTHGPYMSYEGMTVAIHNPSEETVLLGDVGLSVPVGKAVGLLLFLSTYDLLGPPHGQCSKRKLSHHDVYTQSSCMSECFHDIMMKQCGCKLSYMAHNKSEQTCNGYEATKCFARITKHGGPFKASKCDCPPQCHYIHHDIRFKETDVTEGARQNILKNFKFDLKTSGIVIQVYYESFFYTSHKQESIYDFEKLMCDIGGAAGLFLGASFVTIFEFIDFVCYISWLASIKRWKSSTKVSASNARPRQ